MNSSPYLKSSAYPAGTILTYNSMMSTAVPSSTAYTSMNNLSTTMMGTTFMGGAPPVSLPLKETPLIHCPPSRNLTDRYATTSGNASGNASGNPVNASMVSSSFSFQRPPTSSHSMTPQQPQHHMSSSSSYIIQNNREYMPQSTAGAATTGGIRSSVLTASVVPPPVASTSINQAVIRGEAVPFSSSVMPSQTLIMPSQGYEAAEQMSSSSGYQSDGGRRHHHQRHSRHGGGGGRQSREPTYASPVYLTTTKSAPTGQAFVGEELMLQEIPMVYPTQGPARIIYDIYDVDENGVAETPGIEEESIWYPTALHYTSIE